MSESKIVVEQNEYNGKWDVGWESEEGFAPMFCGYATREEAEAQVPGFDERVKKEFDEWNAERDAIERWQNERFPNLAYVRSKIEKIKDPFRAIDARQKLNWLLDLDLAERIEWPLPSWRAIKSGRVYGR